MKKVKTFFIVLIVFTSQSVFSQEAKYLDERARLHDLPITPTVPDVPSDRGRGSSTGRDGSNTTLNEDWDNLASTVPKGGAEEIPLSSICRGDRYKATRPDTYYEAMAAIQKEAEFKKNINLIIALIIILIIAFFVYKDYNEYFIQKVKKIKGNISKNKILSKPNETNQIITELERIQQLKKDGILNEEEVENLKKNILS